MLGAVLNWIVEGAKPTSEAIPPPRETRSAAAWLLSAEPSATIAVEPPVLLTTTAPPMPVRKPALPMLIASVPPGLATWRVPELDWTLTVLVPVPVVSDVGAAGVLASV